ncbi:OmpA family protein [Photobacterium kagoshimensis]|uniref:OmpA family protein n=1 Tax=Photobacterium kagoshimensis TaxID=2910242 RepID=UPI003D0F493A
MRYVQELLSVISYWRALDFKAASIRLIAVLLLIVLSACANQKSKSNAVNASSNNGVTTSRSSTPSPDAKVLLTTLPEHRDVILFDVNSYELTTQAQLILDPIAIRLKNYPDTYLLIVGHSDDDGSDEDNIVLSYERAFSVAIYVTAVFGIEEERLQIIAAGKDEPVVTGSAALDKQQNRRVEVISPQAIVRTLSPIDGKK